MEQSYEVDCFDFGLSVLKLGTMSVVNQWQKHRTKSLASYSDKLLYLFKSPTKSNELEFTIYLLIQTI